MSLYYIEDIKCENDEYFCYKGEDCLDVFVEKMNKILDNFAHFPRKLKK